MPAPRLAAVSALALLLAACQTNPYGPSVYGGPAVATSPAGSPDCKPLPGTQPAAQGNSNVTNAAIGGALGAVAGGLIGRSAADKKTVGTRNGALFGAMAGALAGSQYNKVIGLSEQPDGTVKLNVPGAVLFASGKAELNPEFRQTLNEVAGTIREYCGVTASVVGHTDSTGRPELNETLSAQRAQAVVSYLGSQGVEPYRLSSEGRASREPVASNDDPTGRQQNRRVEIFIRPPAN